MARVFVGLGSNLGDRAGTIAAALQALGEDEAVGVRAISTLTETDPIGYLDQPRFLNGAAELETELPPRALLEIGRASCRERV